MAEIIHLQGGPAHGKIVMVDKSPGTSYPVARNINNFVNRIRNGEDLKSCIEYKPVLNTHGKPWLDPHGRQYYEP